ncbi:hypothetical protein J1605_001689 [Eschrichtius robustus]|uniref:Uncharacterized protein n=1 Tax=Eschrichtius robustus TaxID=9764 RepID=A0AB34I3G2_ESCRO|nr:hypothetical protein J1605_001689 [Eschrichtius robustus]
MKAGEQVGPGVWVRMDPPGWGAELRLNSHGNPRMGAFEAVSLLEKLTWFHEPWTVPGGPRGRWALKEGSGWSSEKAQQFPLLGTGRFTGVTGRPTLNMFLMRLEAPAGMYSVHHAGMLDNIPGPGRILQDIGQMPPCFFGLLTALGSHGEERFAAKTSGLQGKFIPT